MKHLRSFKENLMDIPKVGIFKDSKPLIDFSNPWATKSSLSQFYNCLDCNALWQEVNKDFNYECKFCKSENIDNMNEDDYHNEVRTRLDKDEIEDMDQELENEPIYDIRQIQTNKHLPN